MTHKDIYKKFMIEYDKANITSSYPSLTPYEIATFLDKAYLALIARKFTGNNTRNAGFESDLKAIEDLRPLIVNKRKPVNDFITAHAKNDRRYSIPEDLLYYIKSDLAPTDGRRIPTQIVPHSLIDKFKVTSTNYPWIDTPVAYLQENDIHVLIDPESDSTVRNGDLDVTYIKRPMSFVNSLSNGDTDVDTDDSNVPVDPVITQRLELANNLITRTVSATEVGVRIEFHGTLTTYTDGVETAVEHVTKLIEVPFGQNTDTDSRIIYGEERWMDQMCKWEITQRGVENIQSAVTYCNVGMPNPFKFGNVTGIGNYKKDETVTVTITANSGYRIKKVSYLVGYDEREYPTDSSTRPESSVSLVFKLTANAVINDIEVEKIQTPTPAPTPPSGNPEPEFTQCTITAISDDPSTGIVIKGSGTYNVGDTVTLEAQCRTTYVLKKWESDIEGVSGNENPFTFTLTKITSPEYTITAFFERDRTPEFTDYYLEGIHYRYNDILVEVGESNKWVNVYGDYRKAYVGAYQGIVDEDVEAIFDDPTIAFWNNGTLTALNEGTTYVQFKHRRTGYTTNRILVIVSTPVTEADPNQIIIRPTEIHAKVGDYLGFRTYKYNERKGLYSVEGAAVANIDVVNNELIYDPELDAANYVWSCWARRPGVVTITLTPKTGDNPEQYSVTVTYYITED